MIRNERTEEMHYELTLNLCKLLSATTAHRYTIQPEAEMDGNYYLTKDDRPVFYGTQEQLESVIVLLLCDKR